MNLERYNTVVTTALESAELNGFSVGSRILIEDASIDLIQIAFTEKFSRDLQ